eukprot:TRINITY_DN15126_c0_g1_i20.p2 TRINITY_DN15126_c0_g1~~TRINITY_DN15126_c0_g1_i20.p2  ORF type:complete len:115 (-),score=20.95 TRINITY_DN15126_c0_g1_i20:56-400(-)
MKAFKSWAKNLANIYNDVVVVITFISVLILNLKEFPEVAMNVVGWAVIILILTSLCYLWLTTLPQIAKGIYKAIYSRRRKKVKQGKQVKVENFEVNCEVTVSYTHLTLPTICSV